MERKKINNFKFKRFLTFFISISLGYVVGVLNLYAQPEDATSDAVTTILLDTTGIANTKSAISPVRSINRSRKQLVDHSREIPLLEVSARSIDGSNNNSQNPNMGSAHTQLRRLFSSSYGDGIASLSGVNRPSPRTISNIVSRQEDSILNSQGASDFLWQWGQFLDHDLDLTDGVDPAESANIVIPTGDIHFDPDSSGSITMRFNRSIYDSTSGVSTQNPRQQVNEITSWIDASNIYGSDLSRARVLRTMSGDGKLNVSNQNFLPLNTQQFPNAGGDSPTLFVSGDVRANEQIGLLVMHTLFMREHNRLADTYQAENPAASGDEIYEYARRMVGAMMQRITYTEFLPVLLGDNALSPYIGYRSEVDGAVSNFFSTASYRFGHSALSSQLLRLDSNGDDVTEGHLPLRNAFFAPQRLSEGGLEPVLRGLASQRHQEIDLFIIDDVRNFLFGQPGTGGFDLVSLNIQRGRDHGLPSYNDARRALGLTPAQRFSDISSNMSIQVRLSNAYGNVEDIDAWVGGLAEDHVNGAMMGELNFTVIKQQFENLRDGDRFWYENMMASEEVMEIESTTLADIIRRNTDINDEIQDNVFMAMHTKEVISSKQPASSSGGGMINITLLILLGFIGVISQLFIATRRLSR